MSSVSLATRFVSSDIFSSKFCDWVEENEPTTLTYCVLTRPEAPNEVLLFERYKDLAALEVHGKTQEFKAML